MIGQEQLENYDYLNYLANLTKCDARYTPKIKSGLPWQKRLSIRGGFFNRKLDKFVFLWTQYGAWESELVYT